MGTGPAGHNGHHAVPVAMKARSQEFGFATTRHQFLVERTVPEVGSKCGLVTNKTAQVPYLKCSFKGASI